MASPPGSRSNSVGGSGQISRTRSQFWSDQESTKRAASVAKARFAGDSPADRLRRRAEAVVFPERFNASYLPHYFRDATPAFHALLYTALAWERHLAVRIPRGFSKSTVVTFAYVVHQVACGAVLRDWHDGVLAQKDPALDAKIREVMAEEYARVVAAGPQTSRGLGLPDHWDPDVTRELDAWLAGIYVRQVEAGPVLPLRWDPFIQIIATDKDLAEEFTGAIRKELSQNNLLRADWGDLTPCKTNDWFERVKHEASNEDFESNAIRVAAYGMEGEIRGGKHGEWRPTLAIFDDPDGERTSRTSSQRNHNEDVVDKAVENGLEPKVGRVFLCGTPHHPDCLVVRKTERAESRVGWVALRFRSHDEHGRLLFASRFDAAELADKYRRLGEKAEPELGDRPPRLGNRPFHTVHHYDFRVWEGVPLPKFLVADPSYGKNESSDFQAAIVLRGPTVEPMPRFLVHRAEFWRIADPEEYADALNVLYAEERPDLAAIEAIALGHLTQMMATARGRRELLFPAWIRIERHEQSKEARVVGTSPLVNNGTIVTPSDGRCRRLELQWLNWGESGSKKDGPDVAQMALELARKFGGGGSSQFSARHQPRERGDLQPRHRQRFGAGRRR